MDFEPKSEKEIQESRCLKPDWYDFEVRTAKDKQSKSGNDMIELELAVFAENGTKVIVRDWLLAKIDYKLRHFCDTTGLMGAYDAGSLKAADCEGQSGRCKVSIEDDVKYGPQNRVRDYEKSDQKEANDQAVKDRAKAEAATAKPGDDDIPF